MSYYYGRHTNHRQANLGLGGGGGSWWGAEVTKTENTKLPKMAPDGDIKKLTPKMKINTI